MGSILLGCTFPLLLSLDMLDDKIKIDNQEQDEDLFDLSGSFCVMVLNCIYIYTHICALPSFLPHLWLKIKTGESC